MKKTLALLSILAFAGCAAPPPPPPVFAPLDYSYLRPIVFNVATLNIVNNATPGPDDTAANNPAPPAATLLAMLNHRLQPGGMPGTGTVTVQEAAINEEGGMLNGQMTVDINLTSPDGRSTGFAEASVSASASAPDGDQTDEQTALYQMTKKLMESINVEIPYQIAHNIPNWVSWTNPQGAAPMSGSGAAPGIIQATPLTAPATAPAAMATPLPPVNTNPAVPDDLPGAGPAALAPTPLAPPPLTTTPVSPTPLTPTPLTQAP